MFDFIRDCCENGEYDSIYYLVYHSESYEEYCIKSDIVGTVNLTREGYESSKIFIMKELEKRNAIPSQYKKPVIIARTPAKQYSYDSSIITSCK